MNFDTAVVALAIMTELIRPRSNGAKLIEAMGQSQAAVYRAAMGGQPSAVKLLHDARSAAEKYHAKAIETLTDFWEGF